MSNESEPAELTFDEWRTKYVETYPHQATKMAKRPNSLNKEVELFRDRKLGQTKALQDRMEWKY